jgi:CBS domain-containing protein
VAALPADSAPAEVAGTLNDHHERRGQLLYPVVDAEKRLCGVITRNRLQEVLREAPKAKLRDLAIEDPMVAYEDEPLRLVVHRMAEHGRTRFPVVGREDTRKLMGMISLNDLLQARTRMLEEERRRERVLRLRLPFGAKADAEEV